MQTPKQSRVRLCAAQAFKAKLILFNFIKEPRELPSF